MDAGTMFSELLTLRSRWLIRFRTTGQLWVHLPTDYADVLWAEYRQQLPDDERKRLEAQPHHPVHGGTVAGMKICAMAGHWKPWIETFGP